MNNYTFVKGVIDDWDPIGLLDIGCPNDEYDSEIRDIVRLLNDVNSVDELAVGIQKVFIKWFSEEMSIEKCYPAALKIWNKTS